MRVMEAVRLRVLNLDFAYRQIVVRARPGPHDVEPLSLGHLGTADPQGFLEPHLAGGLFVVHPHHPAFSQFIDQRTQVFGAHLEATDRQFDECHAEGVFVALLTRQKEV